MTRRGTITSATPTAMRRILFSDLGAPCCSLASLAPYRCSSVLHDFPAFLNLVKGSSTACREHTSLGDGTASDGIPLSAHSLIGECANAKR